MIRLLRMVMPSKFSAPVNPRCFESGLLPACPTCEGSGILFNEDQAELCMDCLGTGEAYGNG